MDALALAQDLACQFSGRADAADRQAKMPPEDIQALKESGYLGLSIPTAFGGGGLSLHDCVAAQIELAKGSGSTALVAAMHLHLFGSAGAQQSWPAPAYERLCRLGANGGLFNSVSSEPALGSPSRGTFFSTIAEPTSTGYRINGHKTWTTGGSFLTHMLVGVTLNGTSAAILVEGDRPGIEWEETWEDVLALRASASHDVWFHNVEVPTENLIVQHQSKTRQPQAWAPLMFGSVYLGTAMAARDTLITYALERVPTALGKAIVTLPKIQRQIGAMDMQLQAAHALMLSAAAGWDGHNLGPIAAAKHFAVETAQTVTDEALRQAGAAALAGRLPLERFFRDARAGAMHPPNGDTALEIIGRSVIEQRHGAKLDTL